MQWGKPHEDGLPEGEVAPFAAQDQFRDVSDISALWSVTVTVPPLKGDTTLGLSFVQDPASWRGLNMLTRAEVRNGTTSGVLAHLLRSRVIEAGDRLVRVNSQWLFEVGRADRKSALSLIRATVAAASKPLSMVFWSCDDWRADTGVNFKPYEEHGMETEVVDDDEAVIAASSSSSSWSSSSSSSSSSAAGGRDGGEKNAKRRKRVVRVSDCPPWSMAFRKGIRMGMPVVGFLDEYCLDADELQDKIRSRALSSEFHIIVRSVPTVDVPMGQLISSDEDSEEDSREDGGEGGGDRGRNANADEEDGEGDGGGGGDNDTGPIRGGGSPDPDDDPSSSSGGEAYPLDQGRRDRLAHRRRSFGELLKGVPPLNEDYELLRKLPRRFGLFMVKWKRKERKGSSVFECWPAVASSEQVRSHREDEDARHGRTPSCVDVIFFSDSLDYEVQGNQVCDFFPGLQTYWEDHQYLEGKEKKRFFQSLDRALFLLLDRGTDGGGVDEDRKYWIDKVFRPGIEKEGLDSKALELKESLESNALESLSLPASSLSSSSAAAALSTTAASAGPWSQLPAGWRAKPAVVDRDGMMLLQPPSASGRFQLSSDTEDQASQGDATTMVIDVPV